MKKIKPTRARPYTRKKLAALAGGLLGTPHVAGLLAEKGIPPYNLVRALLGKRGTVMMRDMRKVVALQKYLRLEITQAQMDEICRTPDDMCAAHPQKNVTPGTKPHEQVVLDENELAAAMKQMAEEEEEKNDQ